MRKLKLESLQVESFETIAPAARTRGTVDGHADADTGQSYCQICQHSVDYVCEPETYDVKLCGDTRYFDCTFGCSVDTGCAHVCGASDEVCG